jgi:hypothetical protein
MRYQALDVVSTITFHLGAFGKTWEYRHQKFQEARHPAFGKQELSWKHPTFTFIPMEDRILLPRTQLDSNPRQRAGPFQPE